MFTFTQTFLHLSSFQFNRYARLVLIVLLIALAILLFWMLSHPQINTLAALHVPNDEGGPWS
ncbi:hypothetical protein [Tengunoibacter tsumagoiensis]|uniref:Uncharacterized protein n=1 Tax=Tengunoibacter tsumagoiensis TaxID=2014871 RepID=A0A402A5W7_9CHLR|nr:hypothetical protein [Tengunoibacter tsumagoiensis]GCE14512.1 hypothetical protein KTT_43710 [Tengunoibacter tsumagoiensis]